MSFDLGSYMKQRMAAVDAALDRFLPPESERPESLHKAMRYSVFAGGKRLRPVLVIAGAEAVGGSAERVMPTACALELIHTYSLVHDDLPAMDNDDFRRGVPTNHKVFGEATAILAGDALQALAFEVLAHEDTHGDPAVRVQLVTGLAQAIGPHGMVAGQMVDMEAEGKSLSMGQITRLQRLKTGALISFACAAGAILAKASEPARHALVAYAHDVGLAFQIADDLLDVQGRAEDIGKTPGKDAAAGKATFVSLLGLERARDQASLLADQAGHHLDMFGDKAELLKQAARYVVDRRT